MAGYDITLDIQTRSGVTETTLQSDPPLPEDDIASLLLSGQRRGGGDAAEAVTEQLAAALSGEIVGAVGRAIGFDSVRVEQGNPGDVLFDASLISSDTNPAQRLTFSKRVFPDLEVIVSQSLRESGDVTWILSWQPLSGLELRFVQLDDEDKSYEVRHDIAFGGGVKRPRKARQRRETVRTADRDHLRRDLRGDGAIAAEGHRGRSASTSTAGRTTATACCTGWWTTATTRAVSSRAASRRPRRRWAPPNRHRWT